MKIQPGVKIAAGFGVLLAAYYVAWPAYLNMQVAGIKAPPIAPDRVSLVGLAPDAGRIVVANSVAQVVQASDNFGGNETDSGGATEGAVKKRLPVQEMLKAIAGDGAALGRFAMSMNDVRQDEKWPTEAIVWPADRIRRALDGDANERAALERDLNMTLGGMPARKLSPRAAANGIIIETPVTIEGIVNGRPAKVTGPFQSPYKPRLFEKLEQRLDGRAYTAQDMANEYGAIAAPILSGAEKPENVAETLRREISPELTRTRMVEVERLLRKSTVIVNSTMITGARYEPRRTDQGLSYDLTIRLNEDGRRRLWKYSHENPRTQILLVSDGTAIGAPRISGDLTGGELVISQLPDEKLVKEAVATLTARR